MKRILIVEDQADIRKLIRMTLEFENYEIHEAADGAVGLRMAASIQPDLMLLDVMMPGEFDGLLVVRDHQLGEHHVVGVVVRSRTGGRRR